MIESIGHTTSGRVWMRFLMTINNEKQSGVLEVDLKAANWIADSLKTAISEAEKINVGNSNDTDNEGAAED